MRLFIFCFLLPFCLGKEPSCCMPRKASYNTFNIASKTTANGLATSEKTGKVYLDFDRKVRLTTATLTENGKAQHIVTFTDYNMGKMYEVIDGRCTVKDALLVNGSMPSNCFPGPNAGNSYIGRETFGNTITDVWRTDLTQSHGFMVIMHVSVPDCFPMTEVDYGTLQGEHTQSTTFLSDTVPRVEDPSVFAIPQECQHL